MSDVLDKLLALAENDTSKTVTLSSISMAVLFYITANLEDKKTWLDTENDPLDEITSEEWDKIEEITGNLAYELMSETLPVEQVFPTYAAFSCVEMKLVNGTKTRQQISQPIAFGIYMAEGDAAIGDDWQHDVMLQAGQYRFEVQWQRNTDCGQFDFKINGVTTNAGDLYGAAGLQIASWEVEIPYSGRHVISMVCTGKHASSTGYRSRLGAIIMTEYD